MIMIAPAQFAMRYAYYNFPVQLAVCLIGLAGLAYSNELAAALHISVESVRCVSFVLILLLALRKRLPGQKKG
jgi:hypothetical protein